MAQTGLYELLFAFQEAGVSVVLVLNFYEKVYQRAAPETLGTLRGLRDSFKDILSFIIGSEFEITYFTDPDTQRNLFTHHIRRQLCWIGAMNERDARWVIQQATFMADPAPSVREIASMLALSGHFPALLKSIGVWWRNYLGERPPLSAWLVALLNHHQLQAQLQDLWTSLTLEEQFALAAVQEWQTLLAETATMPDLAEVERRLGRDNLNTLYQLNIKGLIEERDTGWQIRSTLLAEYIRELGPIGRGKLWIDEQTEAIYQGVTPIGGVLATPEDKLTPTEEEFLRYLLENAHKRLTYTELILHLWPETALNPLEALRQEIRKLSDQDLRQDTLISLISEMQTPLSLLRQNDLFKAYKTSIQKVVSDLRKKIELDPNHPNYILNWKGDPGGYQCFPEGRPD